MTTYAIGDVQGCYEALQRLLDTLKLDPARDRLWFCGDLVNRGGESLETLRLIKSLSDISTVVLGNHDLALLSIAERTPEEQNKVNIDLRRVLQAPDSKELIDWLRQRQLLHADPDLGWMMIHAGLSPKWTLKVAQACAREIEERLRGRNAFKLLRSMYGDQPIWAPNLAGIERQRAIINVFTRLRYCSPSGRIAFEEKGAPGSQKPGLYPWFSVPGHVPRELNIVCGHWSTLGLFQGLGVHAIDTGCVWGGPLTALELTPRDVPPRVIQVSGRAEGLAELHARRA
ncbi:MAG: symmetrical bis(5'-nucleosyl)-tetraphosphatase [Xanthomonadaceae bacterium]|nr:symmetrical bis(5'-nucleosyl)-tetraphosphatase [Xanthomonadaceae bacterium]MDP2186987.1 symmetrical bis(5'-nucleosyl)-tetraphosphatase [Xanthomonadales bacterium]MDZ4115567.1 symmetrical bis(5'-nucleosyl)-tetraphosphatase [Xanthomonadaceae bacterium]MDZ4379485.1 symmetrical bis(5'-nucleosyl)-tetraphosphatase [Xanthomonadaceae bacterium]